MDENRLREDQKQFRKLRKLLRQIEHLELVTRKLNEEEEQKVARRDEYRLRLIELTSSYKGDELIRLIDENSTTTTNIDGNQEESYQDQDVVEASTDDLNELVEEFEKMGHKSEPEPEVVEVVNTTPTITKEEKKEEKKVEVETKIPSEKKKKKKPTVVTFDAFTKPAVHVDLITAVDIYPDLGLIVTGRFLFR